VQDFDWIEGRSKGVAGIHQTRERGENVLPSLSVLGVSALSSWVTYGFGLRDILRANSLEVVHSPTGSGDGMEQRVSIITLGVGDLKRSREFYERLGWRRSMAKAEGVVFFQSGGMALALFPRPELAKDANLAPDGDGFNGISLAYNARNRAEVDSVLEEALAAGAKLLKPAQDGPHIPLSNASSAASRPALAWLGARLDR
jgi:catechol 2,3-dioxygenase-like lactoylglutathione lyase family enzyme